MATRQPQQPPYPVQFSVDYPDRDLNRMTTAFRIFTVIPIAIVLGADDPVPPEIRALVVRLEP
jgi:hypothetical protein